MSVKFRKVIRKVLNGLDKGKEKAYAVAKGSYYCDLSKLSNLISSRTAMSASEIKGMLDALVWVMITELNSGAIIKMGEFGNFRYSISSEGVEEDEKKKIKLTALNIKGARIIFTPGKDLRQATQKVTFEPDDVKTVVEECDRNHAV